MEVSLFKFLSELVDWSAHQPDYLFSAMRVGPVCLVRAHPDPLPIVVFLHAAVVHPGPGTTPCECAGLFRTLPVARQSLAFYQNDFAGRIMTKVMQTSLVPA